MSGEGADMYQCATHPLPRKTPASKQRNAGTLARSQQLFTAAAVVGVQNRPHSKHLAAVVLYSILSTRLPNATRTQGRSHRIASHAARPTYNFSGRKPGGAGISSAAHQPRGIQSRQPTILFL